MTNIVNFVHPSPTKILLRVMALLIKEKIMSKKEKCYKKTTYLCLPFRITLIILGEFYDFNLSWYNLQHKYKCFDKPNSKVNLKNIMVVESRDENGILTNENFVPKIVEYYGKFKEDFSKTLFQIFKSVSSSHVAGGFIFYKKFLPKKNTFCDYRYYSLIIGGCYHYIIYKNNVKSRSYVERFTSHNLLKFEDIERSLNNFLKEELIDYVQIKYEYILKKDKEKFCDNYKLTQNDFIEPLDSDYCKKIHELACPYEYSKILYKPVKIPCLKYKSNHYHLRKSCKLKIKKVKKDLLIFEI